MNTHFKIDYIKSEIEKRKLTKTAFARECGISRHALNQILSDKLHISPFPVIKVAQFLDVRVDDLLTRDL